MKATPYLDGLRLDAESPLEQDVLEQWAKGRPVFGSDFDPVSGQMYLSFLPPAPPPKPYRSPASALSLDVEELVRDLGQPRKLDWS